MSPLRNDSKPGSFHISLETGLWKDFASGDGGDLIQLVEKLKGLSNVDAAKWILSQSGKSIPDSRPAPSRGRKPKAPWKAAPQDAKPRHPRIPVEPALCTPYRLADKSIAFAILRWEDGALVDYDSKTRTSKPCEGKSIRPIYPTESGTWEDGLPEQFKKSRPLLGLPRFSGEPRPVLIVEGEKKAEAARKALPGYLVTTWHGGSDNARYIDVEPMREWPDIVVWPDHDEPGRKAAEAIKAKLPQAQLLDVWKMGEAEGKDGWDIDDCIKEGFEPGLFILECPRILPPTIEGGPEGEDEDGPAPFECIGYDRSSYWFLKGAQRIPAQIDMGRFTASLLGELASPAWWATKGAITDKGQIDVTRAQQIIIDGETRRGLFRPEVLRGSGVWLEDGRPLINDGDNIVTLSGSTTPIEAFLPESKNVYVRSLLRFDEMTGPESTAEEGRKLAALVDAQGFVQRRDGVAMLGWSLIAPFGGVLPWRPIVWLLGKTSNGKSWFLDNVVVQLCGAFHFKGTKRTSEASTRRATNLIACPVILDEMTPKTKEDKEKIGKQIELAKNSSGDSSGTSALASGVDSYVIFVNRSPFCFAGVNIPEAGAEISNRVVSCELRPVATPEAMAAKIAKSTRLYAASMKDPARYRRRIFRALPRILEDVEKLRRILPTYLGGQRQADVWAPLLAAAWAVQSDESVEAGIDDWLAPLLTEAMENGADYIEDEDRVIQHILSAQVMSDEKKSRTMAEWINCAVLNEEGTGPEARGILGRHGIRLMHLALGEDSRAVIAIACRHDALARILRDTPYEAGYDAQVRRNPLCLNPERAKQERMAGTTMGCRLLKWAEFRARYMGAGDD